MRCGTLYDVSWLSPKQQEAAKFVIESRNEKGTAISSGPPRTHDGPDNDMDTAEPTDGTESPDIAKPLFLLEDDLTTRKAKILQNVPERQVKTETEQRCKDGCVWRKSGREERSRANSRAERNTGG